MEWGIFAYRVMPFWLTNALATFQWLMCHAFKEYLRDFLEIFMDDLCIHLSDRMEHIEHFKKIFEKCQVYSICLNPEKCKFMVRQGKILSHIVSKNGISTDMDKDEMNVFFSIGDCPSVRIRIGFGFSWDFLNDIFDRAFEF